MRLIDADALKNFYGKWSNKHTEFLKAEVDGYIDAQPTIDAEPVRHGEWIINNIVIDNNGRTMPDRPECSKCGKKSDLEYDFCPNCGAKMDLK